MAQVGVLFLHLAAVLVQCMQSGRCNLFYTPAIWAVDARCTVSPGSAGWCAGRRHPALYRPDLNSVGIAWVNVCVWIFWLVLYDDFAAGCVGEWVDVLIGAVHALPCAQ
jgi:hypothetical protein